MKYWVYTVNMFNQLELRIGSSEINNEGQGWSSWREAMTAIVNSPDILGLRIIGFESIMLPPYQFICQSKETVEAQ